MTDIRWKKPTLLDLAIFETIREPGRKYSFDALGEVFGCSRTQIYWIQQSALRKLREASGRFVS